MTFDIVHRPDLFAELNDRARHQVKLRLRAMHKIFQHEKVKSAAQGCKIAAQEHAGLRGTSAVTFYALYKKFKDERGNWLVLVDEAVAGKKWRQLLSGNEQTPAAFLDYLAARWGSNQRDKFRAVYTRLILDLERWRRGDDAFKIPGFDAPPPADPKSKSNLPPGWSYSNLFRLCKVRVTKFSRKLIQVGPKLASAHGPLILSTRAGLNVGQYIILDDSWNDFKVMAYGQSVRLLSFHALDLFSGCNLMRGYKPALTDERGIEERLREKEMIWLLVALLTTTGYRPTGTTFICEKATATIREREEEIFGLLKLPIKVERGPRGGGCGIQAMFTGPGGGNPRWKAPLESWFNLMRNATADMLEFPCQTGSYSSGLPTPEGLAGIERDSLALVKAARSLPQAKAELLRMGMLNVVEAITRLEDVTELVCNQRVDHALEGWRSCGHYVSEWRPRADMPWYPAESLLRITSEIERAAIADLLSQNADLKRERALTPREVFDAGKSPLVKMRMSEAAVFMQELPVCSDDERAVKNGLIEVACREVNPEETLKFGLVRRDGRGTEEPLREGDKYLVRVNPLDARFCWLFYADGGFAGCAENYGRTQRDDPSQLHRQWSQKRAALAPFIEDGRRLAGNLTRAAMTRDANNADVLNGTPFTPEEKGRAAQVRENVREFGAAAAEILLEGEPVDAGLAPQTTESPEGYDPSDAIL